MDGHDQLADERAAHRARRAAAGLPATDLDPAEGPVTIHHASNGRIRVTPGLTDEHRNLAVLIARAVVELDDRAAHLGADVAERDTTIRELREYLAAAGRREQATRDKVHAVERLHAEAERITWGCSDPCRCTNTVPLGYCRECGEPVPCRTIRALRGDADVYPKPDEPEPDEDDAPAAAEPGHAPGEGPE